MLWVGKHRVLTSVASRFASKVTLLAVESEEGGMDDKNFRTLLSSVGGRTFDDDVEPDVDMVNDVDVHTSLI